MKKTSFIALKISLLGLADFAHAQWGCIHACPTCTCGTHYHWKEYMNNTNLSKDDIDDYVESFQANGEDHDLSEHEMKNTALRVAYELAKHLEEEHMKDTLKHEKAEERQEFRYGRHRAHTEGMYTYLDRIDGLRQTELAKEKPNKRMLNRLSKMR